MRRKDFIRIINEEIGDFDFLNNEKYIKEKEIIELLENQNFQKQFIIDSITKMRDNIQFDDFSTDIYNDPDFEFQQEDNINLKANAELTYTYDPQDDPIKFALVFFGEDIKSHENSDISALFTEINVELYTIEGDKIDFIAFKNAPQNIRQLFIKAYIGDIIKKELNDIK
jgi:hypothetical protein